MEKAPSFASFKIEESSSIKLSITDLKGKLILGRQLNVPFRVMLDVIGFSYSRAILPTVRGKAFIFNKLSFSCAFSQPVEIRGIINKINSLFIIILILGYFIM